MAGATAGPGWSPAVPVAALRIGRHGSLRGGGWARGQPRSPVAPAGIVAASADVVRSSAFQAECASGLAGDAACPAESQWVTSPDPATPRCRAPARPERPAMPPRSGMRRGAAVRLLGPPGSSPARGCGGARRRRSSRATSRDARCLWRVRGHIPAEVRDFRPRPRLRLRGAARATVVPGRSPAVPVAARRLRRSGSFALRPSEADSGSIWAVGRGEATVSARPRRTPGVASSASGPEVPPECRRTP